jgi:protein phosphatase
LNTTEPKKSTAAGHKTGKTLTFPTARPKQIDSSSVVVDIAARSHTGLVRTNNEDSFLVTTLERRLTTLRTNLPPSEIAENYVEIAYSMIVADGMGGAAAGEVASQTAIAELVDMVVRTPDWIMRLDNEKADRVLKRSEERIRKLSDALMKAAKHDPDLSGMGTTLTLSVSHGSDLLIAHVGDSRCYLLTAGKLVRLTKDQTMAQLLADLGVIREAEVATHRQRNVLLDAISTTAGSKIAVELRHVHLTDGDKLLLSSDGLTDMVTDDDIRAILQADKPAAESCEALVEAALAAGGKDNITVILANYQLPSCD